MRSDFGEGLQVGVAVENKNRITRCGVGSGASGENMYVGWYYRFLLLFGVLCLVVITGAIFDSTLTFRNTTIVVATVVAMALWFWFFGQWKQINSDLHAIVYLLGNVAGITLCIRLWDSSALLLFAVYWFGFAYLHTRYAIVYAFVLTISTQWAFGTLGSNIGFNFDTLVAVGLLIVLLGFSAMMARYIEAFQMEAERNKSLVAELKRTQQQLLEREREAGIEQERHRMAGEIHDTLAQHFTSIITNLRAAEQLQGMDDAVSQQHVVHAFSAAQQGLADSRTMLSTMQPDVLLGSSLSEVLHSLATEWEATSGAIVHFETHGDAANLTKEEELMMVRALQEGLRNTGKHAQASEVRITLTWLENEVLLDITDNGIGFDQDLVQVGANGYQLGLHTMQSRVEAAGGTYALESTPGEGTSITISFPTGGNQ